MYPRQIESYYAPETLEEALALLKQNSGKANIIAGGQSLMTLLRNRLVTTDCLIDLNRVAGLSGVTEVDDNLVIGAMTRHQEILTNELISNSYLILKDAVGFIGDLQTRNRGTIGGSLAFALPVGDPVIAALAADASVVLTKAEGIARTVKLEDFITGALETLTEEDEILTEIQVPKAKENSAGAYFKESQVLNGTALIGVGVHLSPDGSRIVVGGACSLSEKPIRALDAEKALSESNLDSESISRVAEIAAEEIETSTDFKASAEYRTGLIKVQVKQMIQLAQQRGGRTS